MNSHQSSGDIDMVGFSPGKHDLLGSEADADVSRQNFILNPQWPESAGKVLQELYHFFSALVAPTYTAFFIYPGCDFFRKCSIYLIGDFVEGILLGYRGLFPGELYLFHTYSYGFAVLDPSEVSWINPD